MEKSEFGHTHTASREIEIPATIPASTTCLISITALTSKNIIGSIDGPSLAVDALGGQAERSSRSETDFSDGCRYFTCAVSRWIIWVQDQTSRYTTPLTRACNSSLVQPKQGLIVEYRMKRPRLRCRTLPPPATRSVRHEHRYRRHSRYRTGTARGWRTVRSHPRRS